MIASILRTQSSSEFRDDEIVGVAKRIECVVIADHDITIGVGKSIGVLRDDGVVEQPGDAFVQLADFASQPAQSGGADRRRAVAGDGLRREQSDEAGVAVVEVGSQQRRGAERRRIGQ